MGKGGPARGLPACAEVTASGAGPQHSCLVPSSSSARAARQHLADQLREIREAARLSGRGLARTAGWHESKVSRVEHGVRAISIADLETWLHVCGVPPGRAEELRAEHQSAAGTWTSYQRLNRAGLRGAQRSVRSWFEQTSLMRVYQPKVVPGLLMTQAYTTEALRSVRDAQNVAVDDIAEAVAERMDRQHVLREGGHRFAFVVEEAVLHCRAVPLEVHRDQLRHLLMVMSLPSVSLGVIPLDAPRPLAWPSEAFTMFDDGLVAVELVSGFLSVTQPAEVAMYLREWAALSALAVHGRKVRRIINAALKVLGDAE